MTSNKFIEIFPFGALRCARIDLSHPQLTETFLEAALSREELESSRSFKNPGRRREFLAGRLAAHHLNPKLPPLIRSAGGEALWGEGFVGSITHKRGWAVAAVEGTARYRSLGLDLEAVEGFPVEVSKEIGVPEDLCLAGPYSPSDPRFLALLFSAKESLYKACFPLAGVWFGFQDAQLLGYELSSGRFQIRLLRDLGSQFVSGQVFDGQFQYLTWAGVDFVLSAVCLEKT